MLKTSFKQFFFKMFHFAFCVQCSMFRVRGPAVFCLGSWFFYLQFGVLFGSRDFHIANKNLKTYETNLKTYEVLLSVFLLINKTFLCLVPRRQKV